MFALLKNNVLVLGRMFQLPPMWYLACQMSKAHRGTDNRSPSVCFFSDKLISCNVRERPFRYVCVYTERDKMWQPSTQLHVHVHCTKHGRHGTAEEDLSMCP